MPMDIPALFQSLAEDFMAGEHLTLVERFAHPLIVYGTRGIQIEKAPEDTLRILSQRLESARIRGAVEAVSTAKIVASDDPSRVSVEVYWTFLDKDGRNCGHSHARYFSRSIEVEHFRIEMIEIISTTLSMEPRRAQRARH